MKALRIENSEPGRNFSIDLRHVLQSLGSRVSASTWRVRDVWATGNSFAALESLNELQTISGTNLQELAEDVVQVIDGVFTAFDPGASIPWVVIEAVDSTFYAVHSDDEAVLDFIRQKFHKVSAHAEPVL